MIILNAHAIFLIKNKAIIVLMKLTIFSHLAIKFYMKYMYPPNKLKLLEFFLEHVGQYNNR